MPYKLEGTTVMEQKDGKWVVKKRYPGQPAKAEAYYKALMANVEDADGDESHEGEGREDKDSDD